MCGIVGIKTKTKRIEKNIIVSMADTLVHRGPDDAGIYIEKGIAFGHRRLSIIDLSPQGHQPMEFDNLIIAYNGEIYNYREIREDLIKDGYKFKSNSDTEVVLKSFHKWGVECLNKFRGMWAFAVWDKKEEKLILCRDRVGVKPLYWYYKEGLFMFTSELKAFYQHPEFCKELDMQALSLFFQFGYIPAPYSIFKYAKKVRSGHFLVSKNNSIEEREYWNVKNYYLNGFQKRKNKSLLKNEDEEIEQQLEQLLIESFKLRLISDVPLGIFLSGGIDSSSVTALLQANTGQRLKTFTIGFYGENTYDEAPWAQKVANFLGTAHTEYYFEPKEISEILPKIPLLYDEPFADSSALPTYLVSLIARKQVKVVLSADGGDELFCGYNFYANPYFKQIDLFAEFIDRSSIKRILLNILNSNKIEKMLVSSYPTRMNIRGKINRLKLFLKEASQTDWDLQSAMMYLDFIGYLSDDILVKIDRATMGVSLEAREPFLDNKLIEYVVQIPVEYKFRNGIRKYILKKVLCKYLPKDLVERPKQGFSIPLESDIYKPVMKEMLNEYLAADMLKKIGIIDEKIAKDLLKKWNRGKMSYEKLWYMLCFQMWANEYL